MVKSNHVLLVKYVLKNLQVFTHLKKNLVYKARFSSAVLYAVFYVIINLVHEVECFTNEALNLLIE